LARSAQVARRRASQVVPRTMKSTQANRIVALWLAVTALGGAAGSAIASGPGEDLRPRVRALVKESLKSLGDVKASDLVRSRAVVQCAVLLAQLGDAEAARRTLRQVRERLDAAEKAAAGNPTPRGREEQWRDLAKGYAEAGEAEGLRGVLAALPAPSERSWGGSHDFFRDVVTYESALALARAGRGKEALELAKGIRASSPGAGRPPAYTPEGVRRDVLREIALTQARAGDFKEALRAVGAIPEAGARVSALAGRVIFPSFELPAEPGIAILQDQAGDHDGAGRTLKQALEIAQGIKGPDAQARERAAIVCAQARVGDLSGALRTLGQVPATSRYYGSAVAARARARAAAGQAKAALETIEKLEPVDQRAYAFAQVVMGQAQAGDFKGARATGEKGLELILTMPERQRSSPLHVLAVARARAKDVKGALETASHKPFSAELTYSGIAIEQARAGDIEGAERTLKEHFGARAPGPRRAPSRELKWLARAQVEQGREKEALAWAKQLPTATDRGYALLGVAEGLVEHHELAPRRR
jgi:tetratricopeptide (TPR) repeat protein